MWNNESAKQENAASLAQKVKLIQEDQNILQTLQKLHEICHMPILFGMTPAVNQRQMRKSFRLENIPLGDALDKIAAVYSGEFKLEWSIGQYGFVVIRSR